jgi:6,7-dimethyl-8-ribityllumazine synthase
VLSNQSLHRMSTVQTGNLDGRKLTIGIAVSRWNAPITRGLLAGAQRALAACQVDPEKIIIVEVPGAFELPVAARALAGIPVNAVIALGCVIKGETAHFEHVSNIAINGIASVALEFGIPVTCGILTTYNLDQALARAGEDEDNKGSEAALTAVETANLLRDLHNNSPVYF